MIEVYIGLFIVGLLLGAFICFRVINFIGTRTQIKVIRIDNGDAYNVMGNVTNTSPDRIGQKLVLFGNDKNEYFVHSELDFTNRFKDADE